MFATDIDCNGFSQRGNVLYTIGHCLPHERHAAHACGVRAGGVTHRRFVYINSSGVVATEIAGNCYAIDKAMARFDELLRQYRDE